MSSTRLRRSCGRALGAFTLGTGLALALLPAAQATGYVTTWDPRYPPIPGLSWRASATLWIPAACEAAVGTGTLWGGFGGPPVPGAQLFTAVADCQDIALQGTVLELYETGNPGNVLDTLLIGDYLADTDGNSYGGLEVETQEIFELRFEAGVPVDFSSTMSFRLDAPGIGWLTESESTYVSLALGWTPGAVAMKNMRANDPANVWQGSYFGTEPGNEVVIGGIPNPGATPVSLPGTAGLTLLGLAALAALRRRR